MKYDYDKLEASIRELYCDEGMSQAEVANELEMPRSSLQNIMDAKDIEKRGRNEKVIDYTLDETMYYILSVLKSDGYYRMNDGRGQIILNVTSEKFAESFAKSLEEKGFNPNICKKEDKRFRQGYHFVVSAYSSEFVKWLEEKQVIELLKKAESREQKCSVLRGFYESEGCLYTSNPEIKKGFSLTMVNTEERFLSLIQDYLEDLELKYCRYLQENENKKDLFRLTVNIYEDIKRFLRMTEPCIKNNLEKANSEAVKRKEVEA